VLRLVEVLAGMLGEHRRRERTVRLALLDHQVDAILVARGPRIRDDTAVAEGARPELRAALHPPDDRARGQSFRRVLADVGALLEREDVAPGFERRLDSVNPGRAAEVDMCERRAAG